MERLVKYFKVISVFCLVLLVCGCSNVCLLENDITLEELESRMEQAMDPKGFFADSKSYYQSQSLKYEGVFSDDLYEIQIRYLKPHFLKVTTLKFNQLQGAFIFNGSAAWSVDYRKKTVKNLSGIELIRIKALYDMLSPGSRYHKLFKNVELHKVKRDNKIYYRLTCTPNDERNKLVVYVNADNYLKELIEYDFIVTIEGKERKIKSTNEIEAYDTVNGVLYPLEMKGLTNGVESETVVSDYRFNIELDESEFQTPIFPNESANRKKYQKELDKIKKD